MATNVLSDTIYMNGLFNGREDNSSRARIPSTMAIDINVTALSGNWSREYSLNMYDGAKHQYFCPFRYLTLKAAYSVTMNIFRKKIFSF